MKLIVATKLEPNDVETMLDRAHQVYGSRNYLTFLTQLWQALPDVSMAQKNGASWLMRESIELFAPQITSVTGLELYLTSEKETSKKKYVVTLVLKVLDDTQEVARLNLTLLSEVMWDA